MGYSACPSGILLERSRERPAEVSNPNALRRQLRDGQWSLVIGKLADRLSKATDLSKVDRNEVNRVINYLQAHGEAGRLDYPKFKLMGLPLGSGSIESAIRRVVNLRMKNNGTFWRIRKAEKTQAKQEMKLNRKQAMPNVDESPRPKSDARQKLRKTQ
jgi:hypothetical protein